MHRKKFTESQDIFESLIKRSPKNPKGYFYLGLAYYKKGDKVRARKELKTALDLDKKFDKADEARKILSDL